MGGGVGGVGPPRGSAETGTVRVGGMYSIFVISNCKSNFILAIYLNCGQKIGFQHCEVQTPLLVGSASFQHS